MGCNVVQFLNRIYVKFRNFAKFYVNSKSLALLWMSLKAKLYILKNHTFLLLGPSSFEPWFESYSSITVGSLHFYDIAPRSSIVFLESSIPSALCRARDLCRRPPPEPLQVCAALILLHASPHPSFHRPHCPRWPFPAQPCRAARAEWLPRTQRASRRCPPT
jgi:hypothetical protein